MKTNTRIGIGAVAAVAALASGIPAASATQATAIAPAHATAATAHASATVTTLGLKNGHSLDVDGVFGPKTRAWVVAFQKAMRTMVPGFAVDGIVGSQTWAALVGEALSG